MPLWSLYRQSVRTQLLWLLCAAMLPLLGLLFRQIYLERLEARERANDQVRILAQQTAQSLNQVLRDYEAVLQRIVQRPLVRALDARACDPLIAEFVRLYPGFTNLVVQDLKGGNDCSFLESKITPEQLALVPGYVQARTAEGMTVGGVSVGPLSGRWVVVLFHPVRNVQGEVAGLVSLSIDLEVLGERLLAAVPSNALVAVSDAQGRMLLRSKDASFWMGLPLPDALRAMVGDDQADASQVLSADGVERLFAVADVPLAGWRVLAGVPTAEVFAEADRSFRWGAMSALGLVLLALLLVWRISQRIVRPIDALHSAAAKVSAGQTQARVMLEVGPRELQAVAVEFNRMLDSRERFLTHLAGSEERFRTLASLSADWYWEQDAQYRFVRLEGGIEQNMGMSEQAFLGKTGWELSTLNMTPEDWRAHQAVLQARMPFRDLVVAHQDPRGHVHWGAVSGTPVWDAQGRFVGYRGVGRNITDAKRQEQERLRMSLHIEELSRRLVQSQEEARRRFSRELHDRTSPNLAALRINLDMLSQAPPQQRSAPEYEERLEDMRALIEDTTLSVREICAELHPPVLDRGGLLAVVRSYAEPFARRTGVQVQVLCEHAEVRLAPDLELALFRVVQEALTNAAKHAHARSITVQLQLQDRPLRICIADDGVGFDVEQVMRERRTAGLGLINMRETTEFAGGRFSLESAPGQGTRICVEI